jgi:CubicO group peptidase (beta-lactamase class C family)
MPSPAVARMPATSPVSRPGVAGQVADGALDQKIVRLLRRGRIAGLSVAILKDGSLVWSTGYGWADVVDRQPVRPDTLFMLASVSKTVTATAIMQLVERGHFGLEDDVGDIAGFPVRNPAHPDTPITVRMLLEHTSSIRDNNNVIGALYGPGDSPIALRDYVAGYLTPGGAYWSTSNYSSAAPGAAHSYSNVAVTLAGYLVEAAAGEPFDRWCERHIFTPLGMDDVGWFLRDVRTDLVAAPCIWDPQTRRFDQLVQYGYPDYPDGQLRAAAPQLARFLGAYAQDGAYEGRRILEAATVQRMLTAQHPDIDPHQGLIWIVGDAYGHNGGDAGVTTEMFYDPNDDVGVILLTNTTIASPQSYRAWMALDKLLWRFARSL